jgi:long-chain acyl-CoA synthetase
VNKQLSPWETVKKFVLLETPFSIESGELTPTLKVKRPIVKERYEDEIESMYQDEEQKTEAGK